MINNFLYILVCISIFGVVAIIFVSYKLIKRNASKVSKKDLVTSKDQANDIDVLGMVLISRFEYLNLKKSSGRLRDIENIILSDNNDASDENISEPGYLVNISNLKTI